MVKAAVSEQTTTYAPAASDMLGKVKSIPAGDLQPRQRHGRRAGVLDLDELEVPLGVSGVGDHVAGGDLGGRGRQGVVIHLGHPQRRHVGAELGREEVLQVVPERTRALICSPCVSVMAPV